MKYNLKTNPNKTSLKTIEYKSSRNKKIVNNKIGTLIKILKLLLKDLWVEKVKIKILLPGNFPTCLKKRFVGKYLQYRASLWERILWLSKTRSSNNQYMRMLKMKEMKRRKKMFPKSNRKLQRFKTLRPINHHSLIWTNLANNHQEYSKLLLNQTK